MSQRKRLILLAFLAAAAGVGILYATQHRDRGGAGSPGARLSPPESERQALAALSAKSPAELVAGLYSLNAQHSWPERIPRAKICKRIAVLLESSNRTILEAAINTASPGVALDYINQRHEGLDELSEAADRFNAMLKPGLKVFMFYSESEIGI